VSVILVDMVPTEETTPMPTSGSWQNSKCFKWVWPNKNPTQILLHHDNAWPHTILRTWKAIIQFGWTVLPHPPYSPIKHSYFNLFGALKDAIRTKNFQTNDVYCTARIWLCKHDKARYQQNIQTLLPHWHDTVDVDGSFADRVQSQTITLPIV
jgi:transposase